MNYITKLDELVQSLPAAVSWTELESRLRVLNAQAHGENLRVKAQRTDTGWLIALSDSDQQQIATWRMSTRVEDRPALHEWPVEALCSQLQLASGGYETASIEDLSKAWRELSFRPE